MDHTAIERSRRAAFGAARDRHYVRPMKKPPLWQAAQQRLAAQSTNGALRVVQGAGHLIAAERPDVVAEEVSSVIAGLGP